ncbi:hypothetical protein UFOVP765_11 [uncultured Caudovirales phage]|uniref:Uncharacterized protein n=1 Tax=uncultured Caudovirales phage TaxID=2100421 RepID=A0A6J5NM62_9CAUD|nr:hypothetical protein UFOVP765_11 [uncultured Caudovirales phage]
MASINASTSGAGGVITTADNTGTLQLQSASTTVATINGFGIGLGTGVPSSGIGITFPATQSASSDANTLDDYEEGTWTPTGNGVTLSGAAGWYTKIGNIVLVGATWAYPSTANTSAAQVSGLPFTSNSGDDNYMGCVPLTNYGSDNLYTATSVGTTTILVRNSGNTDLTNANLSNRFVKFMAIYKV